MLVATAPARDALYAERFMDKEQREDTPSREDYLASDEYKAAVKVLPFCRLWCIVEVTSARSTSIAPL